MRVRQAGWLILLGVVLPFLPQIPGCVKSASPKIGRIVDADTGKGMANIAVIAGARFYGGPILYSSGGASALYETVVKTDATGNYRFPPNLGGMRIGLPGTSPTITWVITAFAPGYALEGDEDSWKEYYSDGHPKIVPRSIAESPSAQWFGVLEIAPLRMKKQELPPRDWALYLKQIFYFDVATVWNDPTEEELRRQAREWIVPLLCQLDPDAKLDFLATATIFIFAKDTQATSRRMIELEPAYGDVGHRQDKLYLASDSCRAMNSIGALNMN